MNADIYTFSKLRKILLELSNSNVGIYRIKDVPKIKTGILLRHDLDSEIESALEVAEMEFDIGIRSTFYFLVSAQFYNVFSQRGREIITNIRHMGHEIGLHFDASIYEDAETGFRHEICIMEEFFGEKVGSVSLHNPSMSGIYPKFAGIINTYDKNLFSERNYFSDSRFSFNTNIKEIIEKAGEGVVQLLFHPTIYCIRNKDEFPNAIFVYKTIIERFGNVLIGRLLRNISFEQEVKEYPFSEITFNIRLKK